MSRTPPKIKLPAFSSHQKTYSFHSPSLPLEEQSFRPRGGSGQQPWSHTEAPFPCSPRPSHRPVTRAPRPHGCSHPSHPTPSRHCLGCRSRPVVTLPGLRLPSTPWNLSPAQQPSGPIKHRPADATPLLGALWGFALSVGIKTKDPQQPLCSLTSVYSPLCPVPALSGAASGAPASPSRRPLPHPVQPPDWELHEEGFGSCAQGTRSVEPDPRQPLSKHGGNPAAEHPTLRRDGDLGPRVEGAAASRVLGTRALRLAGGICSPWARAAAQPRGAARRASHRLNEKVAAKGFG